ncbi:N-6 DNA methylase [bacterium]|nr:N-6 DNA methylase [bacterium]
MSLDLTTCQFQGPALPEPFVKFELEKELSRRNLLPKSAGVEGRELQERWEVLRRKLGMLAGSGGPLRVFSHVIEPLIPLLGYSHCEEAEKVQTREDLESGGTLLIADDGARLRVWTTSFNEDLAAPTKRGRHFRYSHQKIAQRVLLTTNERLGLLTNGIELQLLLSDPARPDSVVSIPLDPDWKRSRHVPDSLRFVLALASPEGVRALPDLVEKARLQQARVTKELRLQARRAVEGFVQCVLDHPDNRDWLAEQTDREALARALWREGLITVYRLLFVLKLESGDDPGRSFTFASTGLWRRTFSPGLALAPYARAVLAGQQTGRFLEDGLRTLFRMLAEGLECTELNVKPLGGALFGPTATPILGRLSWGERAVAHLLDNLLWTAVKRGTKSRERVHYGPLDVEDLGRVYEALLELEPGITAEPMCRLRRQKLEVVVPLAQGEKYHPKDTSVVDLSEDEDNESEEPEETRPPPAARRPSRMDRGHPARPLLYLRAGLGRKATGSYYTPHSFVRFLVQETLGPQVAKCSPENDPHPLEILHLKVLDPAMGSGHFLVEACRFLADKLYEACRYCDEQASQAEQRAESARKPEEKQKARQEAAGWRQRVLELPDPEDELVRYLPSHAAEGGESGLSQRLAVALCRRLVATHCLYGVDKNPLAVELAKLALWLESQAEGMPLTFLDHRLVVGDSLTGPFWKHLIFRPGNRNEPVEDLFVQGLNIEFDKALREAIHYVGDLDAGVGATVSELVRKAETKAQLDRALLPFRVLAAAWSGGVMLGAERCDDHAYSALLRVIGQTGDLPETIDSEPLRAMIAHGLGVEEIPAQRDSIYALLTSVECIPALSYDLTYPEVFYPRGIPHGQQGFNAVLGNPPWDTFRPKEKEYFSTSDERYLAANSTSERKEIAQAILRNGAARLAWQRFGSHFAQIQAALDALYPVCGGDNLGYRRGDPDLSAYFCERVVMLTVRGGNIGLVLPASIQGTPGWTGVRHLMLLRGGWRTCRSYQNMKRLFDIPPVMKFALIVGTSGGPSPGISCMFDMQNLEELFDDDSNPLVLSIEDIRALSGDSLALPEAAQPARL